MNYYTYVNRKSARDFMDIHIRLFTSICFVWSTDDNVQPSSSRVCNHFKWHRIKTKWTVKSTEFKITAKHTQILSLSLLLTLFIHLLFFQNTQILMVCPAQKTMGAHCQCDDTILWFHRSVLSSLDDIKPCTILIFVLHWSIWLHIIDKTVFSIWSIQHIDIWTVWIMNGEQRVLFFSLYAHFDEYYNRNNMNIQSDYAQYNVWENLIFISSQENSFRLYI